MVIWLKDDAEASKELRDLIASAFVQLPSFRMLNIFTIRDEAKGKVHPEVVALIQKYGNFFVKREDFI